MNSQPARRHEILVGRDPDAAVRFDPSREDLVSRQHMKITCDPEFPEEFSVVDLQSRNGTFLNRQRVYGPARLGHSDVIQLGPAGPEFRFELDPAASQRGGSFPRFGHDAFHYPRHLRDLPARAALFRASGKARSPLQDPSARPLWKGCWTTLSPR